MKPESQDDKMIVPYLLGELPEAEQAQLEERAFSDSDYLQQVVAVEKDLIDEYVLGELSPSAREAFERRFLASAHRRRQIEFARALEQVTGENSVTALSEDPAAISDWWNSPLAFLRGPNMAVGFSLAAVALIVVIGGLWVLRQSMQSRKETAQTQPAAQTTPPVLENGAPSSTAEQHAPKEPQPSPSQANRPEDHQAPLVASLLLLPGTSRGEEDRAQLAISPAMKTAQLRVVLEAGDEYKTYAVELRTTSGKLVRKQTGLQAHSARGGRAVVLTLPASLLATGEFELSLHGINEQKRPEPLSYYYFKVRKE